MHRDAALSKSELDVLGCLVDDDEAIEYVVDMLCEDGADVRQVDVEVSLTALKARGLVSRSRGLAGDAKRGVFETDWWHITELGWVALAASGAYTDDTDGLSGDWPPVRRGVGAAADTWSAQHQRPS